MSTINVNNVMPQSTTTVNLNGMDVVSVANTVQIGNNINAPGSTDTVLVGKSAGNALVSPASNNTFVGFRAGLVCSTGGSNTLIGKSSGQNITTGASNTFVGSNAANGASTASANIAIGESAAQGLTTGASNVFIGNSVASTANITGSGNILIGSGGGVNPSAAGVNFEITLGGPFITALRCAQTTITSLSDARDKKDIVELTAGLEFVNTLKPVEFTWNDRDENGKRDIKDFGFIAQDLKQSQEDAGLADVLKLVYESNPEKLEASYGKLLPILVKAVQELSSTVTVLKQELETLKK
jgi:hypothetical protein